MSVRTCARHGRTEFGLYGRARPRWRCKRCIGEAVSRRQQKIKRTLVAEAGGRCTICGYDRCLANLHFHHLDPATKSFAMSMATGKSIAAYREEAKKCVLVCANCHGELEAGLRRAAAAMRPMGGRPDRRPPIPFGRQPSDSCGVAALQTLTGPIPRSTTLTT